MSTRSIIAVREGDGFRGRYCHSDGYPTSLGKHLFEIYQRDGTDTALRVLLHDHYGWSSIYSDRPSFAGVRANIKADYTTLPYLKAEFSRVYGDGRYVNVPGYGIAYSDKTVKIAGEPYRQTEESEWYVFDRPEGVDTDARWAYAVDPEHKTMSVFRLIQNDSCHLSIPQLVSVVKLDESEPDWGPIECGSNYERCSHYAHVHFSDIPEESQRLSTDQWLGRQPLTPQDAVAFEIAGIRYKHTGSGSLEWSTNRRTGQREYGTRWNATLVDPSGVHHEVGVWDNINNEQVLRAGVTAIYPPTLVLARP